MSDKPRMYVGVRVKTTVKELLQRHRAREASKKKERKTITQACLDLQELCAATFPTRSVDPPTSVPTAEARSCAAQLSFPDAGCSIPPQQSGFCDIQQQFGDILLPGNSFHGAEATPMQPPSALQLSCGPGLSSDADYYGPGTAPCSSPESLRLCHPVDPNSYSPHESFSSSSSSCYDSPSRMESSFHSGFASEHYHYQHFSLQDTFCPAHCWSGPQDSFSAPDPYAPYYSPTDYQYACPNEDNYLKRDWQMSTEMCYNIL